MGKKDEARSAALFQQRRGGLESDRLRVAPEVEGTVEQPRARGKGRRQRPVPPEALAAAFARAIAPAGARARLYAPRGENKPEPGTVSIAAAVASGRAFMVPVSRWVLAADADDLGAEALQLAEELELAGERPVVASSGGKGVRLHVFARIDDEALLKRWEARARELGLDPRHEIRPPYAPHRVGGRSTVANGDPSEALAALSAERPPQVVSRRIWRLLHKGDESGRYSSTSEVAMAIVTAFVAAGWREGFIRSKLLDQRHAGGAKLHCTHERIALRAVEREYDKAVRRVTTSPSPIRRQPLADEWAAALTAARDHADAATWRGTGGAHRRALLEWHHSVAAREADADGVYVSTERQDARGAGVSERAVRRLRKDLEAEGWLVKLPLRPGDPKKAPTRWRIPKRAPVAARPHAPAHGSAASNARFDHDAFRHGALGKQKARILSAVESGEATAVAALVELLGVGAATVRKHVGELVELELLERLPHRQLGRGPASLDDVAATLGVAGVGALQRSGHETERELRRGGGARTLLPVSEATPYVVNHGPLVFVPRGGREAQRPERRAHELRKIAAAGGGG